MHEYFQNKTVLVTGAAGFIGSHLVDKLLQAGASVVGVDNLVTGRKENISHLEEEERFTYIQTDAAVSPGTYLSEGTHLDVVLHFASPASPPHYQAHPFLTYQVNVFGTHNILEYLHQTFPEARFLFASTSEVYGDPAVHPQPEEYWGHVNPNGIRSCYDEGKRMGETIAGVFFREYGVDARLIRIFNTYGPRINPTDKRVIPDFISQALKAEPLQIFGTGEQTRSYCYSDDLVEGILRVVETEGLAGETFNLGNPEEYTVNQTAEIIRKKVHELYGIATPESTYHPLPQDDPQRRQPDITKAQRVLGWKPQVSFEEGLRWTIEYFKNHEL